MSQDQSTIAAFSEAQVEYLTKLRKGRLRYWERTGFFAPSYLQGDESSKKKGVRIYSFRDIVALRTLEMLRVQNNVPLQHLRKVAEKLSKSGLDVWARTTLWVMNRKVIFQPPGGGKPREVLSGQYVMDIPLSRVVEDTHKDILAMGRRKSEDIGVIRKSSGISGGPVLAGTRIRVASVKRLAEDGYSIEAIRAEYPDLTVDDINAALAYSQAAA